MPSPEHRTVFWQCESSQSAYVGKEEKMERRTESAKETSHHNNTKEVNVTLVSIRDSLIIKVKASAFRNCKTIYVFK